MAQKQSLYCARRTNGTPEKAKLYKGIYMNKYKVCADKFLSFQELEIPLYVCGGVFNVHYCTVQ